MLSTCILANDRKEKKTMITDAHHRAQYNARVLTTAQALGGASPAIIVSLGGLVGLQLASNPAFATLPISIFNLGLAIGTLPAAWLMKRFTCLALCLAPRVAWLPPQAFTNRCSFFFVLGP